MNPNKQASASVGWDPPSSQKGSEDGRSTPDFCFEAVRRSATVSCARVSLVNHPQFRLPREIAKEGGYSLFLLYSGRELDRSAKGNRTLTQISRLDSVISPALYLPVPCRCSVDKVLR